MSDLPPRCVPCEGGIPPLSREEAEARHVHVEGWTLDHPRLSRDFRFADFRAALAFVNAVGALAEDEGHHPDIHVTGWNHVRLELWTHAVDGLTDNDFVLARKIDALA